jgi:hypothetical protein
MSAASVMAQHKSLGRRSSCHFNAYFPFSSGRPVNRSTQRCLKELGRTVQDFSESRISRAPTL